MSRIHGYNGPNHFRASPGPPELVKLLNEGEDDRAGLCTQCESCWHCRVVKCLKLLSERADGYGDAKVTAPTDASDEAIRQAACQTASGIGLFAATWPEFYAFGLAVADLSRKPTEIA